MRQSRTASEYKGSLAERISRNLLSSNASRSANGSSRSACVHARQYEGTMSITVASCSLISLNNATGSAMSSTVAMITSAPNDSV